MIMGGWKETSILLIVYILEGEGLMANITKQKRDQMIAFLEELKREHSDDASVRAFNEIENHLTEKKFGLVFEEHTEFVDEMLLENIPVLSADDEKRICRDEKLPWNFILEGDNLQALYLLEKTHLGKIDCVYIDPPYNTGARDWKYNNDYVEKTDVFRHSKWLSMMQTRLKITRRLMNPQDSILTGTGKTRGVLEKNGYSNVYRVTGYLRDVLDGVRADKNNLTINDLYNSWVQLKRGLKDNTFSNYKYMYTMFVEPDFGKSRLVDLKRSDVRGFYNYLADERNVQVNTIDSIHTVCAPGGARR